MTKRNPPSAAWLAGALAGVAVATAVWRRWQLLRVVPRELRTRDLWVPLSIRTTFELRAARRMLAVPAGVASGVHHHVRQVPAGPDGHAATVHVFEPEHRAPGAGAVLWMHGGGMVAGSAVADQDWASRVASDLGAPVVSVDYRLAPEHPYPAALEDCFAALTWLAGSPGLAEPIDTTRITVAGASAGGGLAASLAQLAHDRGGPAIAFQLLEYPMLDDRTVRRPVSRRRWLVWTPASNAFGWRSYLDAEPGADDVPVGAVPARRADLSGLPPVWIGVGDLDLFQDEDVAYAEALQRDGVACELHVEAGMYHGVDFALDARAAITAGFRTRMVDALRPHVSA